MVEEAAPVIICEVKNSYDSDGYLLSSLGEEEVKSSDCKIDDNEPDKNHLTESENMLTTELPTQVTNNTATQDQYNILFSQTDCPADYVRRGVLRLKNLEVKKRLEEKLLNSKLATQEIKKTGCRARITEK
ncbi:unnamed protein product [Parnassius apollo]|uniref:(apollo) hypothetical protein n=1 Tax=Parnassius apollo TaxID=110799 RepID=A0A8S3WLC4_PARAO|nr:unnamed protein product [Parnassius apollo]